MFRQPGMSRQPAGILASSPELSNVVRQRMGQPVQMAHGGYHPPRSPMGRVSTSRRPVPGNVRIPLVDALPKSGFARPALDDFLAARGNIPSSGIGAIRGKVRQDALTDLAMQSIRQGGTPFGDDDGSRQMSDAEIMAANRANLAALRSAQGLDQGATVPATTDDASSIIDQGIAAAKSAVSGDYMRPVTDAIVKGVGSDVSSLASLLDTDTRMSPANVAARSRVPSMDDNPPDATGNVFREAQEARARAIADANMGETIPPFGDEFGNIDPDGTMPGETLAATATTTPTDGVPRKVSTVNPETTTTSAAQQNISDNVANIKGDIFNPKDQKKLTDAQATNPDVLSTFAYEAADFVDPEAVNLENVDKAAKDIMGFDPKAAGKKKEEAFWMGLMKAGLAIAAGGSENAMTNIAKGLSYGLDSYSKDIATLNEQERADMKEFRQLKTQMIRDERSYNLSIAGAKNTHEQHQATIKNQFKRDKIDLGFKQADMLMKQRQNDATNGFAFAQLQNQAAFQIAKLQQGDQQVDLNREKLAAQLEKAKPDIVKIYQGFGYLDDEGKATDKGIEAYGTELGVLNAMTTSSSKSKTTDTQRSINALTRVLQGSNDAEDISGASESSLFKETAKLMQTEDVNEVLQQLRKTLPVSQPPSTTPANTTIPTTGDPLNLAG